MTDPNAPIIKHQTSAAQHLAAVHAAQVWIQDLAAQHLLKSQSPIRDEPFPAEQETPK